MFVNPSLPQSKLPVCIGEPALRTPKQTCLITAVDLTGGAHSMGSIEFSTASRGLRLSLG